MSGTTTGADEPVRLGFTGVGKRGEDLLTACTKMDDVEVPAICDLQEWRLEETTETATDAGWPAPSRYEDHVTMLEAEDLDAVVIATSWRTHIPMAIEAMERGVTPGMDVGPAQSVRECWDLVRTAERTGEHCMLLENACFGDGRLAALEMVREGLFGELVHAQCGYIHDIRPEIHGDRSTRMPERDGMGYRTLHFLHRNADVYPTHGIGPKAKYMNVNRGNRFLKLTATSSKSRGQARFAEMNRPDDAPTQDQHWALGDIVTSVIECANGESIIVNHDCSSPRPRSSRDVLQGTNGLWEPSHGGVHFEDRSPHHEWEDFDDYREEYKHPLWETYEDQGVQVGQHGGTDYLTMRAFVSSVVQGVRPPVDVYDAAAWMAITPLSENSIAKGGAPVTFPDFTNGEWLVEKPIYGLTGDDVREGLLDFGTMV